MLQGLDTGLAALFITIGTPLAGLIPVLIGWGRITAQRSCTGQHTFPKALWSLTASICIGPIGMFAFWIIWIIGGQLAKPHGVDYTLPPQLWVVLLGIGFILSGVALMVGVCERNAARAAVLTGSIAVALFNISRNFNLD